MNPITLSVDGSTVLAKIDGEWHHSAVLDEPLRTQVRAAAEQLVAMGYWDWHMPDGTRERFLKIGPRLCEFQLTESFRQPPGDMPI